MPILVLIISLCCKSSVGEYYTGGYFDPAYAYLMNSLNLSQMSGYGVGHIDHPGTPVQIAGAVIIKLFYTLENKNTDIVSDVISNPEYYLTRINLAFIFLTSLALFILGFSAFRKTGKLFTSCLLQLTLLYPSTVYDHFTDVSSESLFIVAILLFITVIIFYSFGNNDFTRNTNLKYILCFSLVCGFGLACKIIFLPLLIIPLLLIKRNSFKLLFLSLTFISFIIFVIPAISMEHILKYYDWLRGIAMHSGKYGTGREDIIETSSYLENIRKIFTSDFSFTAAYFLILAGLILRLFKNFRDKIRHHRLSNVLTGIFLAMTFQILIVAKHFDSRYMIPAYMLCVPGLIILSLMLCDFFPAYSKKIPVFFGCTILSISLFRIAEIYTEYSQYSEKLAETVNLDNFLKVKYSDCLVINSNIADNIVYCLYFGADWSGAEKDKYYSEIGRLYPENFYFDRYIRNYYLTDIHLLKSRLSKTNKFIFRSEGENMIQPFMENLKGLTGMQDAEYKIIYSNKNSEVIYEITLLPAKGI